MFFLEGKRVTEQKNQGRYILDSGRMCNNTRELEYYYERIDDYWNKINTYFDDYFKYLKKISNEVKKFGGDGSIHGCIIDISLLAHIYANPQNGKLIYYYAENQRERKVYSSCRQLLKENERDLYNRFENLIMGTSVSCIDNYANGLITDCAKLDYGYIYYLSNKIHKIQNALNSNVIGVWYDGILNADSGKDVLYAIADGEGDENIVE